MLNVSKNGENWRECVQEWCHHEQLLGLVDINILNFVRRGKKAVESILRKLSAPGYRLQSRNDTSRRRNNNSRKERKSPTTTTTTTIHSKARPGNLSPKPHLWYWSRRNDSSKSLLLILICLLSGFLEHWMDWIFFILQILKSPTLSTFPSNNAASTMFSRSVLNCWKFKSKWNPESNSAWTLHTQKDYHDHTYI